MIAWSREATSRCSVPVSRSSCLGRVRSAAPLVGLSRSLRCCARFVSDVPRWPAAIRRAGFRARGPGARGPRASALGTPARDGRRPARPRSPCSLVAAALVALQRADERRDAGAARRVDRTDRARCGSSVRWPGADQSCCGSRRRATRRDRRSAPSPRSRVGPGVLLVRRLLTDPDGPLFGPERDVELGDELRRGIERARRAHRGKGTA